MDLRDMPPLVDPSGSGWGGVSFSPGGGGRSSFGDFGADTSFSDAMPSHFEGAHEQFPGWDDSGGVTSGWGSPGHTPGGFGMGGSFGGPHSGFGDSAPFSPHPSYAPNNPYPSGYSTPPPNWAWPSSSASKLGRPQKYQLGLSRSKSHSPYSNASSLTPDSNFTRSYSSGHSNYREAYAERPSEWRQGFSFRSGLASLVPRRTPSSAGDRAFGLKPSLHPYLRYSIANPQVDLDLRLDPATIRFRALGRDANTAGDFTRLVCDPPVLRMRLFHDRLPWNIDIQATDNPIGVTFLALFQQMWISLMTPIQPDDFYNHEMDDSDREKVTRAWRQRVGNNPIERAKGVLRVDFLRGHVLFQGLSRTRDGHWEIKTKKI